MELANYLVRLKHPSVFSFSYRDICLISATTQMEHNIFIDYSRFTFCPKDQTSEIINAKTIECQSIAEHVIYLQLQPGHHHSWNP